MASQTPLDAFFAEYPAFAYNPASPARAEFSRMCRLLGFQKPSRLWDIAYARFRDALTEQFNHIYGTDVNDYASWKMLAEVLRISPLPDTIPGCRKKIKGVFVNITDLVDTPRTGESVKLFKSESALADYTITSDKFFPREEAKAGGILKFLLRQIMNSGSRTQRVRGPGR
ncbi:hypothetical protein SERLA73DRAFT_57238 [Serpula lacrymans var. lacrymans S7.3]|uniref:Uncharacterized protein n=2 Tax=Serpula lacrymans var. lacrymans TaxID=341189 RepID=F8Q324_SERL3|nr:uncharacterized protein SERLADRAFT_439921 [Serpula lacrymans var. lacrymans S7.9]EGN97585.1 hypothetical protein SERLA73DRAFT_57238 [Serpula lacrymans var. lacrymans S7.3]EGO23180.1 hypothetical protein SERLADRAFT_439921 [Serpula lacrymans var. lacrymans S7.9]